MITDELAQIFGSTWHDYRSRYGNSSEDAGSQQLCHLDVCVIDQLADSPAD